MVKTWLLVTPVAPSQSKLGTTKLSNMISVTLASMKLLDTLLNWSGNQLVKLVVLESLVTTLGVNIQFVNTPTQEVMSLVQIPRQVRITSPKMF